MQYVREASGIYRGVLVFFRHIEQQVLILNGCRLGGDMVRKLSLMLVLTLGLVPLAAQALGLGDIKLNSALNQKLNAEIALLSLAKGEIYDVKVTMASDEVFKRAGVDRSFLLTTLSFKPELKADGTAVVTVTSKEPIREPFLNFLIEVNWPKGRLVREYTVLLDPPVTLDRKPAPIEAPKVTPAPAAPIQTPIQTQTTPVEEAAPTADVPYTAGADEVKVDNNQSLWVIARNNKYDDVDHTRMMMAIYHANPQAFIKSNINRLKRGAILRIPKKEEVQSLGVREAQQEYKRHVEEWQADRLGTKKAEPEIAAESETAPEELKAEDVAAEESKPEEATTAQEETKAEDVAAEQEPKAEGEQAAEADKKGATPEQAKPEATAAQDAKVDEKAEAAPKAELKIATARPEGEGEAGPSEDGKSEETVARLKQQLLILEESAESTRGENEELSSRVEDLEDQVKDLERIIELKNKQFAALQAALAKSKKEQILLAEGQQQEVESTEKDGAAVTPEAKQPESETAAKTEQKPEPAPVEEEKKPETKVEKEQPKAVEKQPEPAVDAAKPKPVVEAAKPEPVVEKEKQESVVKPLPKVEKKPAKVAPVAPKAEPEPSLMDAVFGSPTLLGVMLAVVMVLLGLIWILFSRKRTNTADFQESILLNTIDDESESHLDEANNIPAHTEETSFLSDFSPSDIDALQDETGEVDPLSEADVYIAYGRYQQAEELIRQAIDKEPERDALKHKLFEILYATKDSDGFMRLVEEASGSSVETSNHAAWKRVLSMGKMLLPNNPKFADADEIDADNDLFSLDDDLLEEDMGESDFADLDATLTEAEFGVGNEDKKSPEEKSPDDILDIAGDLDDTGVGLDNLDFESDVDDDFISAALDELEELDDSLGSDNTAKERLASQEDDDEDEFTLTLSDLEDEGEKTILSLQDELNVDKEEESETGAVGDLEDLDISDDMLANELEETHQDIPEISDTDLEVGDSELISLGELDADLSLSGDAQDEISTKLDLAQAYIEMGDKEGATDILDEVLSEGDATQREKAQKIKDSIS